MRLIERAELRAGDVAAAHLRDRRSDRAMAEVTTRIEDVEHEERRQMALELDRIEILAQGNHPGATLRRPVGEQRLDRPIGRPSQNFDVSQRLAATWHLRVLPAARLWPPHEAMPARTQFQEIICQVSDGTEGEPPVPGPPLLDPPWFSRY